VSETSLAYSLTTYLYYRCALNLFAFFSFTKLSTIGIDIFFLYFAYTKRCNLVQGLRTPDLVIVLARVLGPPILHLNLDLDYSSIIHRSIESISLSINRSCIRETLLQCSGVNVSSNLGGGRRAQGSGMCSPPHRGEVLGGNLLLCDLEVAYCGEFWGAINLKLYLELPQWGPVDSVQILDFRAKQWIKDIIKCCHWARTTNIGLLYPKVSNNIGGGDIIDLPQPKYWGCVLGIPGGVNACGVRT